MELTPVSSKPVDKVLHILAKNQKNVMDGHVDIFNGNVFVFMSDLVTGFLQTL